MVRLTLLKTMTVFRITEDLSGTPGESFTAENDGIKTRIIKKSNSNAMLTATPFCKDSLLIFFIHRATDNDYEWYSELLKYLCTTDVP